MIGDQLFIRLAKAASRFSGRSTSFVIALGLVLVWLVTGPLFDFSNTWQLVINTLTSIVTFLMVFLIQNTQNRDTEAMQIKLDELIRVTQDAHDALLDLEELGDRELAAFRARYIALAQRARERGDVLNDLARELGARDAAARGIGTQAEAADSAAPEVRDLAADDRAGREP